MSTLAVNGEVVKVSLTPQQVWKMTSDLAAKHNVCLGVLAIVTDFKHSTADRVLASELMQRLMDQNKLAENTRDGRRIKVVSASGDTIAAACTAAGAEKSDLYLVYVSEHAPERKQTLEEVRDLIRQHCPKHVQDGNPHQLTAILPTLSLINDRYCNCP